MLRKTVLGLVLLILAVGVGVVHAWGVTYSLPQQNMFPGPVTFVTAEEARMALAGTEDPADLWLVNSDGETVVEATYGPSNPYVDLLCLFGAREDGTCHGWPAELPEGEYEFHALSGGNSNSRDVVFAPNADTCGATIVVPESIVSSDGIQISVDYGGGGDLFTTFREKGQHTSYCSGFLSCDIPPTSQGLQVEVGYGCNGGWIQRVFDVEVVEPALWYEIVYRQKEGQEQNVQFHAIAHGDKSLCQRPIYTWDFDDGSDFSGRRKTVVHTYLEGGYYQPTLEVTCLNGDVYESAVAGYLYVPYE